MAGALVVSGLASCLKDKTAIGPDNTYNIIEIANIGGIESSTTSPVAMFSKSFDIATDATFDVTINYAGAGVAPQDITVNLNVDSNTLKLYNTANSVSYTLIPSSLYTLPASVVIPKGQRTAIASIKFKTPQFDLSKTYGFPLNIVSSSYGVISGNFGRVVYRVGAKNKYDGVYTLRARLAPVSDRTNVYTLETWDWAYEVQLITTGERSVALYNSELTKTYAHPLRTAANANSSWGSFTPEFTFDASDNLIKVNNYVVNPSNGRGADLNATVAGSKYDATKKVVYAAFNMTQPSMIPLPHFDTLTYKRAR